MRTEFLRNIGFAAMATAYIGGIAFIADGSQTEKTRVAGGRFVLVLDDKPVAVSQFFEGGSLVADAISEKTAEYFIKKHVGNLKYEEISLKLSPPFDPAVSDWINLAIRSGGGRKSGQIVAVNFDGKAASALDFSNALVMELDIPDLDGSSKDSCFVTVKFLPISTQRAKAVKANVSLSPKSGLSLRSNFVLNIDGVDCSRVMQVGQIRIRQGTPVSSEPDGRRVLGKIDFPNLNVVVPEASASDFYSWHEDFVLKGNNGDQKERKGTLTLLSANRQTANLKLNLYNIGILGIRPVGGAGDPIRRVEVEMYCERMELATK